MTRSANARLFASLFAALLLVPACAGQGAPAIEFNTANAGLRASDVEAAVAAICLPADITRSKDGSVSGCRVCPKGTDFHGDGRSKWEMYAETPGHFTSPQADNLLLDGTGCDSHASNFGGSIMFALKSGKPLMLRYDQGLVTSRCHKFPFPDGRDFLVCRGGWTGQGENIGTVFMSYFDANGKDDSTKLIAATDTTGTCADAPTQVVRKSEIGDIKFSSGDTGQITGMTIIATLGDVKCSQVKNGQTSGKPSGAARAYEIEFLFDGRHFKVTPASRSALARFDNN